MSTFYIVSFFILLVWIIKLKLSIRSLRDKVKFVNSTNYSMYLEIVNTRKRQASQK